MSETTLFDADPMDWLDGRGNGYVSVMAATSSPGAE
jgi:hypothetical protein